MQIINAIASLIAWFAAKKVDDILGKWVAYIQIAFQNSASKRAMQAYDDMIQEVQSDMEANYGSWDTWREKVGIG
jgi:hypothetical protein